MDNLEVVYGEAVLPPPAHLFFMTSESYTGNLGGVAGADEKCARLAETANLAGTFKAILYTSAGWHDVSTRIAINGAVYDTAGELIATASEFWWGDHQVLMNRDERGHVIEDNPWAWTGITAGLPETNKCASDGAEWTSDSQGQLGGAGYAIGIGSDWVGVMGHECNQPHRLYCINQ
jgi:hypothetical protein